MIIWWSLGGFDFSKAAMVYLAVQYSMFPWCDSPLILVLLITVPSRSISLGRQRGSREAIYQSSSIDQTSSRPSEKMTRESEETRLDMIQMALRPSYSQKEHVYLVPNHVIPQYLLASRSIITSVLHSILKHGTFCTIPYEMSALLSVLAVCPRFVLVPSCLDFNICNKIWLPEN